MLLRVATILALLTGAMVAPATAFADGPETVTVDVQHATKPATRNLTGVTWNAGDLAEISPLEPAYVRTGADLEKVSPREGVLELDDLFDRISTIYRVGSQPVILLNHMPSWLARPVPDDCRQDRRQQAPCPSTAMGPRDIDAWEKLVEDVVRQLADHFDRDLTFELWNEPNNTKSWADSDESFIETALAMHRAIARVEGETGHRLRAGGVALGDVDPLLSRYREAAVKQGTPPAFISWHHYTRDPLDYRRDVSRVRDLIDDPTMPLAITEWNHYGRKGDERATAAGAAFNLASLIEMERAGVSWATFYRSVSSGHTPWEAGLVSGKGVRRPSWWVQQMWANLDGDRLVVSGDDPEGGLWARATRDGDRVDVVLSSYAERGSVNHTVKLDFGGACQASTATVRTINMTSSDFTAKRRIDLTSASLSMASPTAAWVTLTCKGAAHTVRDGSDAVPAATSGGRWLLWSGLGLAAIIVALFAVRATRRPRR